MTERRWRIDAGVARALGDALGWSGDDGPVALSRRVPSGVLCGSTAKLAAIERGEVPPGDDPEGLARRLLDHLVDRASDPAGGAASPSWSCWVTATVAAGLLDAAELGPVRVAATRRIDDRAPDVDLHAAVLVGDGADVVVCDPYFGVGLDLPVEVGATQVAPHGPGGAEVRRTDALGWVLDLRLGTWTNPLRYRLLAPDLHRDDVRALCAISVPLSGVPPRPYARIHLDDAMVDVRRTEDSAGVVTQVVPAQEPSTTQHPSWDEAVEDFAARTGVRVV